MQIIMITINSSRDKNLSFKLDENKYQTVTKILWSSILWVDSKELENHEITINNTMVTVRPASAPGLKLAGHL